MPKGDQARHLRDGVTGIPWCSMVFSHTDSHGVFGEQNAGKINVERDLVWDVVTEKHLEYLHIQISKDRRNIGMNRSQHSLSDEDLGSYPRLR